MKLFASDYDGTLNIHHAVSKQDKEAICRWREMGNLFALVSGRSMESLKEEMLAQNIEADFYIGNNGGAIYDSSFQAIKTYYFSYKKAMDIIDYLKKEAVISYVVNDGYHRAKQVLDPTREDKKYGHTDIDYPLIKLLANRQIAQIVAVPAQEETTIKIANYINTVFADAASAYRNIHCVDIAPQGISKASGIAYLLHHLHMPKADVYTVGDSYNDIPMLSTFYGFALAHADPKVKETANSSVTSVAQAIHMAITS